MLPVGASKTRQVVVFGQNAGRQRVAMGVCAKIYHNMKKLSYPGGLKQVMHIGNQLKSGQLLTTSKIIVFPINWITSSIRSYSGNVHGEATIEGYEYCVGEKAFEPFILGDRKLIIYFDTWLYHCCYCLLSWWWPFKVVLTVRLILKEFVYC